MAEPVIINLRHLARGLDVPLKQVQSVVDLLDEGNTVAFITRYRKDQTGGLDEEQVRQVQSRLAKMRLLAERKQTILRSIELQGKLTETLDAQIREAATAKRLEDLYLPYKPKKQTLATTARSRGLEPLADEILRAAPSCADLDARASDYANPDRQVPTGADALLGAGHILAERFSETAELRQRLREILEQTGKLVTSHLGGDKPPADKGESPRAKSARRGKAKDLPLPSGEAFVMSTSDLPIESVETGWPDAVPETEFVAAEPAGDIDQDWLMQVDAFSPQEIAPHLTSETVAEEELSAQLADPPALEVADPEDPPQSSGQGGGDSEQESEQEAAAEQRSTQSPVAEAVETSESPNGEVAAGEAAPETAADAESAVTQPEVASPQPETAETEPLAGQTPDAAKETPVKAKSSKAKRKKQKAEQKRKKELQKKKAEERLRKAFSDYFDYREELRKIPPHRVLAINRGERAKVLRVKIECDMEAMYRAVDEVCVPADHPHAEFLRGCARDALVRLILPSLEREVRRELTEYAEQHAVEVFAKNLRNLLLQPPVHDRRVLAVDPGYKSGSKLVALDQFGNVLAHDLVYLVGNEERKQEARRKIAEMVERYQLTVVAIGNGTGGRDAEEFFSAMIAEQWQEKGISYVMVNEAGASVYSTSQIGREEFPGYDAALRGAISIGRRLQDPLSELVKIDPANIGVGLYQHDVKAKHLRASLDEVVESCVNYVGVEVNTASPALLRYVSGLNQLTARRLCEHRMQNGPFRNRQQLREVAGFGDATFVQAAGFLKISGGDDPMDATWIHPESYEIAGRVLTELQATPVDLAGRDGAGGLADRVGRMNVADTAKQLGVGELTLKDIVSQLARPGRDPREELPPPVFKQGVLKLENLTPGMELTGTVLNVVDFGAFIDIGMHDSGLVHVSRLADRFVRDPHEVVTVGDIVRVWVVDVDKQRRRVSLTMIPPGSERKGPPPRRGKPEQAVGDRPPRARQDRRPRGKGPPRHGQAKPSVEYKPKPKPVTPISDEMKTGKKPMRSFSDLAQFFQAPKPGEQTESQDDEDPHGKKKKKK